MSRSLVALLAVLIVGAGYLGYLMVTKRVPCVTPIHYQLVQLDPGFKLSTSEALEDIKIAAAVWNEALGKDVLVEGSKPDLPIYFQYGTAQYDVDTIESLNEDIDSLHAQQVQAGNEYAARAKEGASEEELAPLLAKYYDLKKQIDADIARGQQLPTNDIKEGRYVSDDQGTRVYIYGYQNKTELMRALTHELGHALGLDHVENSDSIMYPSNGSSNLQLTAEDRTELARACGK